MFFGSHLLLDEYIFIPINRRYINIKCCDIYANNYTQPKTTGFLQVDEIDKLVANCRQVATSLLKSSLLQLISFADLLQVDESTCIELVH
jgi:hypothetical protein